jgi:hypothetical protein
MAYNKSDLYKKSLDIIENDSSIIFIEDIISLLPCSKPTFYEKFPLNSDELNTIKKKLESNKVAMKTKIRRRLLDESATGLIALYKIICTEEEAHRLNGSKKQIDHTTKGNSLGKPIITWVDGEEE